MISVIIVDPDQMFCQMLKQIVMSQEIDVLSEAMSGVRGIELVRQYEKKSPLIVLVNTQLPDRSGEAVCRHIYRHWPNVQCIFLMNTVHWPTLNRLIQTSAKGFVTKEACYLTLEAIRIVSMGKSYLQPDLALNLWDYHTQPNVIQFAQLTPREYEILNLLARNRSYREIAGLIHVGVKTVYNLKTTAFKKLAISSLQELAELLTPATHF